MRTKLCKNIKKIIKLEESPNQKIKIKIKKKNREKNFNDNKLKMKIPYNDKNLNLLKKKEIAKLIISEKIRK